MLHPTPPRASLDRLGLAIQIGYTSGQLERSRWQHGGVPHLAAPGHRLRLAPGNHSERLIQGDTPYRRWPFQIGPRRLISELRGGPASNARAQIERKTCAQRILALAVAQN